jgi:hypothetical protein
MKTTMNINKELDIDAIDKKVLKKILIYMHLLILLCFVLSLLGFQNEAFSLLAFSSFFLWRYGYPTLVLKSALCPNCNLTYFSTRLSTTREMENIIKTTHQCIFCKTEAIVKSKHLTY